MNKSKSAESFLELVRIIKRLRDPEKGCPWDLKQTHASLKPYLIEESYEVLDAIDSQLEDLPGELGDVLLQVMLHSQIAEDENRFSINEVIETLNAKLIERHPHIFGDVQVSKAEDVTRNWERIKNKDKSKSVLDGVPASMPALLRAHRVGEKAARVGFEWDTLEEIKAKVIEELEEFLEAEQESQNREERVEEEFGDLLFALCQFARRSNLDSEALLSKATSKFSRRFQELERRANYQVDECSLEELDRIWEDIKAEEKQR